MSCVRFEDPEAYRIDYQAAAPKLFTRAHSETRRRSTSSERRAFSILPPPLHSPSTLALALNNAASHCAPPPTPPINHRHRHPPTLSPYQHFSAYSAITRSNQRPVQRLQSQRTRSTQTFSWDVCFSALVFPSQQCVCFFGHYPPPCRAELMNAFATSDTFSQRPKKRGVENLLGSST